MSEAEIQEIRCSECNTLLAEDADMEITDGGTFCRSCFVNLTTQLKQIVAQQGKEIDYPKALVGGLLGGVIGILAWWGVTVLTGRSFGIVAIVIGIAVGKGILLLSNNKRSRNLQIMSIAVSFLSFLYATYLVNRTFIIRAFVEQGEEIVLPYLPNPALFAGVLQAGFDFFDLIFLAIVIYEAWKIPAPIQLGKSVASNE